jgi:hypothetical protein
VGFSRVDLTKNFCVSISEFEHLFPVLIAVKRLLCFLLQFSVHANIIYSSEINVGWALNSDKLLRLETGLGSEKIYSITSSEGTTIQISSKSTLYVGKGETKLSYRFPRISS